MTKSNRRYSVAWVLVLVALRCTPSDGAVEADAIYLGGPIVTLNDAQPSAEALAVKDGKILAVGPKAEVEKAHKGTTTKVVDLDGRALAPGFVDGHAHFLGFGSQAVGANLLAPPDGTVNSIEGLARAQEARRYGDPLRQPADDRPHEDQHDRRVGDHQGGEDHISARIMNAPSRRAVNRSRRGAARDLQGAA